MHNDSENIPSVTGSRALNEPSVGGVYCGVCANGQRERGSSRLYVYIYALVLYKEKQASGRRRVCAGGGRNVDVNTALIYA